MRAIQTSRTRPPCPRRRRLPTAATAGAAENPAPHQHHSPTRLPVPRKQGSPSNSANVALPVSFTLLHAITGTCFFFFSVDTFLARKHQMTLGERNETKAGRRLDERSFRPSRETDANASGACFASRRGKALHDDGDDDGTHCAARLRGGSRGADFHRWHPEIGRFVSRVTLGSHGQTRRREESLRVKPVKRYGRKEEK